MTTLAETTPPPVDDVTSQMEALTVGTTPTKQKKKKKNKPPRPPPQSFFEDFGAFHDKLQAGKYKVHKPNCTCSKMQKVRNKVVALAGMDRSDPRLDCLSVLSDTSSKSISHGFFCPQTTQASFDDDRVGTEHVLRNAIFQSPTTTRFKLSCAACLLDVEPNGFVCIESTSREAVEAVRDVARAAAQSLADDHHHHDHGDFVVVLARAHLLALRRAKTRAAKSTAQRAVWEELQAQGVVGETQGTAVGQEESWEQLNLNHHIVAALDLRTKGSSASQSMSSEPVYWFVLGYINDWGLELPGGKRHLGESAWECAKRETAEETSLVISDDDWKCKGLLTEDYNSYFLLDPRDRGQ